MRTLKQIKSQDGVNSLMAIHIQAEEVKSEMASPPTPVISVSNESRKSAAVLMMNPWMKHLAEDKRAILEMAFQLAINAATEKLTKENELAARIYRQQLAGRDQQIETLTTRIKELERLIEYERDMRGDL